MTAELAIDQLVGLLLGEFQWHTSGLQHSDRKSAGFGHLNASDIAPWIRYDMIAKFEVRICCLSRGVAMEERPDPPAERGAEPAHAAGLLLSPDDHRTAD